MAEIEEHQEKGTEDNKAGGQYSSGYTNRNQ
jgi:hypothetical protein